MSFETKLFDQTTDKKLELFACNTDTKEVFHPYVDAVLQLIQNKYGCNRDAAYNILVDTTINTPILIGAYEYWVE